MESGDDYKHLSSFSKPNSNAIVWSYALASLNMRKSKKYSRYSCRYAKKALQMNKNVNTLKTKSLLKTCFDSKYVQLISSLKILNTKP